MYVFLRNFVLSKLAAQAHSHVLFLTEPQKDLEKHNASI